MTKNVKDILAKYNYEISDDSEQKIEKKLLSILKIDSLNEVIFQNTESMYRYIAKIMKKNSYDDLMCKNTVLPIIALNEHLDLINYLSDNKRSFDDDYAKMKAQIGYHILKDRYLKKELNKIQKSCMQFQAYVNELFSMHLMTVLTLASYIEPKLNMLELKSFRILEKIYKKEELFNQFRYFAIEKRVDTAKQWGYLATALSFDGEMIKVDEDYFNFVKKAANCFLEEWSDFYEEDDIYHEELINQCTSESFAEYTDLLYSSSYILDSNLFKSKSYINDAIDYLYRLGSEKEQISLDINPDAFNKIILDEEQMIDKSNVHKMHITDYFKGNLSTLLDDASPIKRNGNILAFIYGLANAIIYENDGEYANISLINKTEDLFLEYQLETKKIYQYYVEFENNCIKDEDIIIEYDEYDRDLFKKFLSLLEFFSSNGDNIKYTSAYKSYLSKYAKISSKEVIRIQNYSFEELEKYLKDKDRKELSKLFIACNFSLQLKPNELLNYNIAFHLFGYDINNKNRRELLKGKRIEQRFFNALTTNNEKSLSENEKKILKYFFNWINGEFDDQQFLPSRYLMHTNKIEGSVMHQSSFLDNKDVSQILAGINILNKNNKLNYNEFCIYMHDMVSINKLIKRYDYISDNNLHEKQLSEKNNDLRNASETNLKVIDEQKAIINDLNIKIKNISDAKDTEAKNVLKSTIKKFKEDEQQLKDEIKELKVQIESLKNEKIELQNNIQKLEDALTEDDTVSKSKLEDVITNENIVIVGGRYEKHRILEENYPNNIRCVYGTNFSKNILLNADIIIYLYEYVSHGTYMLVKSCIDITKNNFAYCKYNNVELIENKIAEVITNLRKEGVNGNKGNNL